MFLSAAISMAMVAISMSRNLQHYAVAA